MSDICIGDLTFATKARAIQHFREMLGRYEVGNTVSEADAADLRALLERHPIHEQKRGPGIAGFSVISAPGMFGNTRTFMIRRVDGTTTDFSFLKCISAPGARVLVHRTLRYEVSDDILAARQSYFAEHANGRGQVPCRLTGVMVSIDQARVDHAPPYTLHTLATTFLLARKIAPEEILLEPSIDNQYGRKLCDRTLAADWRAFHHGLAHLRIISADEDRHHAKMAMPNAMDRQLTLKDPAPPGSNR